MQQLLNLYRQWKGTAPASTERLVGAGSNRAYYRLRSADGQQTVIGCVGTSSEENHAFIALSRHFASKGLPVPHVLAATADERCYLQTDLGGTALFDALSKGRASDGQYDDGERELLRQAMRELPRLQFVGAEGLDFSVCYPQPAFDAMGVMFDLNYFKYCFLKATGVDFHEVKLEEDFQRLTADLLADEAHTFLYRDFQARNIMLTGGGDSPTRLAFIDFQGGRRGPVYYDLASFLWQASARYPDALRRELVDVYYDAAHQYGQLPPRPTFDRRLQLFVFFRTLQVLGAYGFRGYFERKQHFIDSIPPAIDNLRSLLDSGRFDCYAHLTEVLGSVVSRSEERGTRNEDSSIGGTEVRRCGGTRIDSRSEERGTRNEERGARNEERGARNEDRRETLEVSIYSFSFKKGIPADESGNGGGYVFDCRGTNNPGRYEAYKKLTGLDEPVIRFLEDDGEILTFLDSVYRLADAHVQRYIDRGFTHLQFAFGCTGGQHRSVYSAQHLAEHIHRLFPAVQVHLCHREQGIVREYGSTGVRRCGGTEV